MKKTIFGQRILVLIILRDFYNFQLCDLQETRYFVCAHFSRIITDCKELIYGDKTPSVGHVIPERLSQNGAEIMVFFSTKSLYRFAGWYKARAILFFCACIVILRGFQRFNSYSRQLIYFNKISDTKSRALWWKKPVVAPARSAKLDWIFNAGFFFSGASLHVQKNLFRALPIFFHPESLLSIAFAITSRVQWTNW